MDALRKVILSGCVALAALFVVPGTVLGRPTPPACIDGTSQTFSATGALQSYALPPGTTALLITANGASGGRVWISQFGPLFSLASSGVHLQAGVTVSGLTTVGVVVGGIGGDGSGLFGGGGGGGGSFVFTPSAIPLVAAGGGGGGAFAFIGGNAQLTPAGTDGSGSYGGAGGTSGSGGGGDKGPFGGGGGGGGGFFSAGGDGTFPGGGGGHQVSPPGDGAGGAGVSTFGYVGGSGGYGGGAGAVFGGGGGGGYSGGGGGDGVAGGGGSFVAPGATTYEASVFTIGAPMDGSVTICATAIAISAVPALDRRGLLLLALLLAGLGVLGARSSNPRFLARRPTRDPAGIESPARRSGDRRRRRSRLPTGGRSRS